MKKLFLLAKILIVVYIIVAPFNDGYNHYFPFLFEYAIFHWLFILIVVQMIYHKMKSLPPNLLIEVPFILFLVFYSHFKVDTKFFLKGKEYKAQNAMSQEGWKETYNNFQSLLWEYIPDTTFYTFRGLPETYALRDLSEDKQLSFKSDFDRLLPNWYRYENDIVYIDSTKVILADQFRSTGFFGVLLTNSTAHFFRSYDLYIRIYSDSIGDFETTYLKEIRD